VVGHMLLLLATALAVTAALLSTGSVAAFAYFSRDLPSPEKITERYRFQSTKIYDRNGVLLHEVYNPNRGRRVVLSLREIPEHVRQAFLAAEDARFYENPGVDVLAIVRAAWDNTTSRGERFAGGSTITQQLVKYTLLTDERTLPRKIREAILAIKISRTYTKDQILEMYLNSAFFGHQAYGIESAADTYFGKSARDLSRAEGILLAGLLRSPSTSNPFTDERAAKAEQRRVLEQMIRHKMATQEEAEQIAAEPLTYNTKQFGELKAPHFALWVREQLAANPKYGEQGLFERGLEVTTTLDIRMQEMAEFIVREHAAKLGPFNASNSALVAINPATGEILAMVGSADFHNKEIKGEVNVSLAHRQPGSSIKPVTYLAAFQKGWHSATIVEDVQTTFPGTPPYTPRNYDGRFHGKVSVRSALANSYNIPAVKALQHVGVPAMIDLARKMGITTFKDPSHYGLALTLGGGEVRLLDLVAAYGVFANHGKYVRPVSILRVTDASGNLLDQWPGQTPQPVVDPGRAYMITSILADNEARTPAFGPNSPLKLSRPAAAKTGTTDDFKDNWTIGYTSQLVTGVWVGNADNTPMRGTTGLTGAAPIWHDFMEFALAPLPVDPLSPPPGLVKVALARDSGRLWVEGCPEPRTDEYFTPGDEPKETCDPPTPTPTPTASPTPEATQTPSVPTVVPTPTLTVEQLRARGQATQAAAATSAAQAVETRRAGLASPTPSRPAPQPSQTPRATQQATQQGQTARPTSTPAQVRQQVMLPQPTTAAANSPPSTGSAPSVPTATPASGNSASNASSKQDKQQNDKKKDK
jgi:1A family penicillin-binding protein